MDNHSKKLSEWFVGGIVVLMFPTVIFGADYFSFGKSINEPLGSLYIKSVVNIDIFVPVSGTICNVDLAFNIDHPSFCDFQICIGSPELSGDTILINSYDVYTFEPHRQIHSWMVLDGESMFDIDQSWEPYMGLFKPNGSEKLSSLYGQQSYGWWHIQIYDMVYFYTGTLKDIRLDMLIDTDLKASTPFSIPEPATLLLAAIGAAFSNKSKRGT